MGAGVAAQVRPLATRRRHHHHHHHLHHLHLHLTSSPPSSLRSALSVRLSRTGGPARADAPAPHHRQRLGDPARVLVQGVQEGVAEMEAYCCLQAQPPPPFLPPARHPTAPLLTPPPFPPPPQLPMGDTKLENFECPCSLGPQCPSTLAKVRKHIEGLSMEPEETGPDCAKTSKLTCANLPTCDCHEPCLKTEYVDHALDELSKYCYATAPKGEATCVADGPLMKCVLPTSYTDFCTKFAPEDPIVSFRTPAAASSSSSVAASAFGGTAKEVKKISKTKLHASPRGSVGRGLGGASYQLPAVHSVPAGAGSAVPQPVRGACHKGREEVRLATRTEGEVPALSPLPLTPRFPLQVRLAVDAGIQVQPAGGAAVPAAGADADAGSRSVRRRRPARPARPAPPRTPPPHVSQHHSPQTGKAPPATGTPPGTPVNPPGTAPAKAPPPPYRPPPPYHTPPPGTPTTDTALLLPPSPSPAEGTPSPVPGTATLLPPPSSSSPAVASPPSSHRAPATRCPPEQMELCTASLPDGVKRRAGIAGEGARRTYCRGVADATKTACTAPNSDGGACCCRLRLHHLHLSSSSPRFLLTPLLSRSRLVPVLCLLH